MLRGARLRLWLFWAAGQSAWVPVVLSQHIIGMQFLRRPSSHHHARHHQLLSIARGEDGGKVFLVNDVASLPWDRLL